MKTKHVIRIKNSKDILFEGSNLDDCKKEMKPAFFDHIDKGLEMNTFPLEAVTITEVEPEEPTVIVTLSNGKTVANFSSPHSFKFTDGSELPAVSDEESERLKVTFIETVDEQGDVLLKFELSEAVRTEMKYWYTLYLQGKIDVVFCCLPMITALNETGYGVKNSPFRACRMEDKIKKLLSIDKQCL